MWKRLHKALAGTILLDSYVGSYEHTQHCEHMLLSKDVDLHSVNTAIQRKFPTCQRLRR
jgi:hypothetical protein